MALLSILPITLLLFLLPVASLAQFLNALIAPLPLEVCTPFLNSGISPPPNWNITTGELSGAVDSQSFFNETTGKTMLVRVDGNTYSMFGDLPDSNRTTVQAIHVTPTRTVFSFTMGPMSVNATFFTPVEPGDFVKQSTPLSYLFFTVESNDDIPHDVQIFTGLGIGGTFLGSTEGNVTWTANVPGQGPNYAVQLEAQSVYQIDANQQAKWGTFYLSAAASTNVTSFVTDSLALAIDLFFGQGVLQPSPSSQIVGFADASLPLVFALSQDLGSIKGTQSPVVFVTGYIQDPVMQYIDIHGNEQNRSPYYRANYSNEVNLIDDYTADFPDALTRALTLESKIAADAAFLPPAYMDLVSLSTRFVYASTAITIGTGTSGKPNTSDVMAFLKNTGEAVGARVSAVETLYATWPMFMYLDPSLGKLLLEPLLKFQSENSALPYAAMDLGHQYPNATENAVSHSSAIEQTANMLIMTYAYVRTTGDGSLISKYYELITNWAELLVQYTLYIAQGEASADGLAIANQTNLAFKGIVAIRAMSDMSAAAGKPDDSSAYGQVSLSYGASWKALALGSDQHLLASYGDETSWSLGYNYFADLWLGTEVLTQEIVDSQIAFLSNMHVSATLGIADVGVPLDIHRPDNVTSSWDMLVASYASGELQNEIIAGLHNHAGYNQLEINGNAQNVTAQSVALGAVYAPLALRLPVRGILTNVTVSPPGGANHDHMSSGTRIAAALGGIAAAAVLAAAAVAALRVVRKRRRQGVAQARFGPYALPLKRIAPALARGGSVYSAEGSKLPRGGGWKNLEDYEYHDI
ncbi:hypothetical protein BC834DRAFT_904631 [Gloeopeniophorella convolvens]|nr:hypothetical protein BC834DRAFT_904631 [Gloeopeniophorella convolvens]